MLTALEIMKEIDQSLEMFGEYTYLDKGASEVMDIERIAEELKKMSVGEILLTLNEVENNHRCPGPFLSSVMLTLQEWVGPEADEFFDSEIAGKYY
jgi:flavoprotein